MIYGAKVCRKRFLELFGKSNVRIFEDIFSIHFYDFHNILSSTYRYSIILQSTQIQFMYNFYESTYHREMKRILKRELPVNQKGLQATRVNPNKT